MMPSSVPDLVPMPPLALADPPPGPAPGAIAPAPAAPSPEPEPANDEAARRDADLRAVAEIARAHHELLTEIEKRIVGQRKVVDHLLTALFARGHCLFVGVPGLAKTLLISTLAETLNLSFQRIQFTPDLMPADITGTEVLEEDHATGRRTFRFIKGPVFANLVLADEINRTPPKTQAALLQSMQEYRVTAGGHTHELMPPFLVFATQNPIEQEGTYPLPEAQLDRFLFKVTIGYPGRDEERAIVARHGAGNMMTRTLPLRAVADLAAIQAARKVVRDVKASDPVLDYVVDLVRATRERPQLLFGASPRAAAMLAAASRSYAALQGRDFVLPDDVKALAVPALRHRVGLSPSAEIDGLTTEAVIKQILELVPAPR